MYHHRQTGWVLIVALGGSAVLIYLIGRSVPGPVGTVVPVLLIGILALFHSMTVRVDNDEIRISLGIGLIRKRIRIDAVRSCRVVRNPWYYGWGIHLIPGGILYNVSGTEAVELTLDNQRLLRIGTDQPRALEDVLRSRQLGVGF